MEHEQSSGARGTLGRGGERLARFTALAAASVLITGWPSGVQAQPTSEPARVHLEFSPGEDHSGVVLRSDRPIRHTARQEGPTRLILEIDNALPRSRNDLHPVVTRYFPSGVDQLYLLPVERDGGHAVRLIIELKEELESEIRMVDGEIRVDIETPTFRALTPPSEEALGPPSQPVADEPLLRVREEAEQQERAGMEEERHVPPPSSVAAPFERHPGAPPEHVDPAPLEAPADRSFRRRNLAPLALGVGGAGLLATGGAFGLQAKRTERAYHERPESFASHGAAWDAKEAAIGRASMANVLLGVGAVALGGSVVLWMLTDSPDRRPEVSGPGLAIEPIGPGSNDGVIVSIAWRDL